MGSSRRFIVLCLWTIREYMRSAYCNSGVRVCSCVRYYVPRIQFIIYLYLGGGGGGGAIQKLNRPAAVTLQTL